MSTRIRELTLSVLGGLWGGAVAGLTEAVFVALGPGDLQDFGFVPYAVIGYALLGAAVGTGFGIVRAAAGRAAQMLPNAFGLAAGIVVAAVVFVVGRYHVNLRFFHEELTPWTAGGAAAHLVLVLMALAALALSLWVGRRLGARQRPVPVALGALVALVAVAVGVGASRRGSETVIGAKPSVAAPKNRPNVILVIADTLRADAVSAYGASAPTPAIDALAKDGVRFARAYAPASWTRPSIATLLTALSPRSHGTTNKMAMIPERVITVAEALRDAGYWTAGFVSNINVAPVFNFQQGFAEYTYLAPSFYFWATDSAARLALYHSLRLVRERFFADRIYVDNYYRDARVVTDHATHWIDSAPQQPFFLLVHYMDPHDPYFEIPYNGKGIARVSTPNPPAARADELRSLYLQNVRYLDEFLAQLWKQLRAAGLYDNSLIVFVSDHGEEFQEHGGWWHGTTLFDEALHVPLIVKRPQQAAAGTVVDTPVEILDFGKTALSACGIPAPRAFEGADLFGEAPVRPLVAEEDLEGNLLASIRLGSWKLITANPNNPRGLQPVELYDVERDPREQHNRAGAEPDRVSELLAQLTRERSGRSGTGIGGQ